ncbi:MAG: bacillithiol biosynthesis cysteine-adding enzyme BshC [Myxococcota bacterium]
MTRAFTDAWIAGEPAARRLLPHHPWTPETRAEAVRAAAEAEPRSDAVPKGSLAVVTGQQVGLFLGPLYTFYKAASAVVTARVIAEETGRDVVPVFWMATEDHDLPEAATCGVPGDGPGARVLSLDVPDERPIPVAYRRMGPSVEEALAGLDDALDGLAHAGEVLALLRRHYRPEATLGEAFEGVLGGLLGSEGLVIVHPRDPALMRAAAPVHRWAFERAGDVSEALRARAADLEAAGFDVPVHVRPGAPLSFVHPDGPDGPRYRVEPHPDGWALVGDDRVLPDETVRRWLEEEPERFSASALLRPLIQDVLLPTVGYVGGPGEIAYLAQTPPLYEAWGRSMPLTIPRNRLRVVGPRERRVCHQLGLQPADAARPRHELLAEVGGRARRPDEPDPEALEARLLDPLRAELGALEQAAGELDPGFAKAVRRTEGTLDKSLGKLIDRYRRTLAKRDEVVAGRVDRLVGALAPGGGPQERVFGLPAFAARYGVEAFRRLVMDACEPFPTEPEDVEP